MIPSLHPWPGLVLGSKAVGEPSVLGGVSVLLAIRSLLHLQIHNSVFALFSPLPHLTHPPFPPTSPRAAVASARRDGGLPPWVRLGQYRYGKFHKF